jgi:hypothetical protein
MNELPPAVAREPIHTRRVTTQGFLRADGLWDLEGELIDTKAYDSASSGSHPRAAGEPIHHMRIRLTIDDDLVVREAVAVMVNTPFGECAPAAQPFDRLVGAQIGLGWRIAVNSAMGNVKGCTHLRELLSAMATVAFQTVGPHRQRERRAAGLPPYTGSQPAHMMGKCTAWDFNGAVIARVAPQFIGWVQPSSSSPSSKG